MEFIIQTDLNTALPAKIDFNFEEQKAWLVERLEFYNGLVVTEDTIKESKADRAKLNKLKEAMDTRRKEIKREWLKPYNEFEAKVKELTALVDKPIGAIDGQLKAFDEQRKEEKMQQIIDTYASLIHDTIKDIIPLERIFDKRWLNATMKMEKVEDEMIGWGKRVNADLLALDTVEPEYKAAVRAEYMKTLDIAAALAHRKALKTAADAFRAQDDAKPTQQVEPATAPVVEPVRAETETPAQTEKVYLLRLEMQLTMNQANALKRFLSDNHIDYTKI